MIRKGNHHRKIVWRKINKLGQITYINEKSFVFWFLLIKIFEINLETEIICIDYLIIPRYSMQRFILIFYIVNKLLSITHKTSSKHVTLILMGALPLTSSWKISLRNWLIHKVRSKVLAISAFLLWISFEDENKERDKLLSTSSSFFKLVFIFLFSCAVSRDRLRSRFTSDERFLLKVLLPSWATSVFSHRGKWNCTWIESAPPLPENLLGKFWFIRLVATWVCQKLWFINLALYLGSFSRTLQEDWLFEWGSQVSDEYPLLLSKDVDP